MTQSTSKNLSPDHPFLTLSEQYTTLQGEGKFSGMACHIIRSVGCDIRCQWCDTDHAFYGGKKISFTEIINNIPPEVKLVLITGGEPLLEKESVFKLIDLLSAPPYNKKIILETGGHISLAGVPDYVHICMDIKLPGSGEDQHDFASNFSYLKREDEIKFVVADERDMDAVEEWISRYALESVCNLLVSPVSGAISLEKIAERIIKKNIPVRMQVQLHKIIWGENATGV